MLQKLGKKIVIISNSSRRKGDTLARLRAMGFGPCEDEDEEAGLGRPGDVPPISVVSATCGTDLMVSSIWAASRRRARWS